MSRRDETSPKQSRKKLKRLSRLPRSPRRPPSNSTRKRTTNRRKKARSRFLVRKRDDLAARKSLERLLLLRTLKRGHISLIKSWRATGSKVVTPILVSAHTAPPT